MTIALAHKQVRAYHRGKIGDFLGEHTSKYPFVGLQETGGSISTTGHSSSINFRLFFFDLVHVSTNAKENELDVESDMVSIAQDIIAQLNNPNYTDWRVSTDNSLTLHSEGEGDMYAGCYIDISISTAFTQNICQIPTVLPNYFPVRERARITLYQDLVTGELSLTISELDAISVDSAQIVDAFIMTASNSAAQAQITVYQDPVTGALELITTAI